MTAHKHSEMIKAKADNMDLVLFACSNSGWVELSAEEFPNNECFNYFACLQQHKAACLHWLNGGKSQTSIGDGHWVSCDVPHEWNKCQLFWYLNKNAGSRIKHKKEKRWICYDLYGCFVKEVNIEPSVEVGQVFEIEIEV
jgi:hypothetical protein